MLLTGWATAIGSGVAEAARLIDAEIDNATGVGALPQYYLGLAAEVLLAAGRPADGLAHLDRAIAGIDEPGIGFYLPEIYRLRGECLLACRSYERCCAAGAAFFSFAISGRDPSMDQPITVASKQANKEMNSFHTQISVKKFPYSNSGIAKTILITFMARVVRLWLLKTNGK